MIISGIIIKIIGVGVLLLAANTWLFSIFPNNLFENLSITNSLINQTITTQLANSTCPICECAQRKKKFFSIFCFYFLNVNKFYLQTIDYLKIILFINVLFNYFLSLYYLIFFCIIILFYLTTLRFYINKEYNKFYVKLHNKSLISYNLNQN